jgi:hypothetical protein
MIGPKGLHRHLLSPLSQIGRRIPPAAIMQIRHVPL